MADRCDHGARVGQCDECADRWETAQAIAEQVADKLLDRLPHLAAEDQRELDWWRESFSCRFRSGNLPRPGDALYGSRFVLMVDVPEDGGGLSEYWNGRA